MSELVAQTARLTFSTIPRFPQSLHNSLVSLGELEDGNKDGDDSMDVIIEENQLNKSIPDQTPDLDILPDNMGSLLGKWPSENFLTKIKIFIILHFLKQIDQNELNFKI